MVVIVGYAPLVDGVPDFSRAVNFPPKDKKGEVWIPLQTPQPVVREEGADSGYPYPHNDGLGSEASLDFEILLAQLVEEFFEAGSSEDQQVDFDMIGLELSKQIIAMYRSRLPRPPRQTSEGSQAVILPRMADQDIDDLSSPFWQLVKSLLSEIPPEMDSLGMGVRRKAVAQILLRLPAKALERPTYPLIEYAARYAHLREAHWNDSSLAVVVNPKKAVKLGHDCPSGERLDTLLDLHRKQGSV